MQYQVPQFIEIEDKIFGPLTFKQFAYLAGGAGASVLFFTFFPLIPALLLSAPFIALAIALAFVKINDRPFADALEHAVIFYLNSKLYLWKQRETPPSAQNTPAQTETTPSQNLLPRVSESKLKDIAWSLNIKDREHPGSVDERGAGFEI